MINVGEEIPVLVGQSGPLNGQRWMLNKIYVLGREDTCDIVISNRQVSRQHARIYPAAEGILLEDLNSKNGTHCNGTRIANPIILQDGDAIQIALAQDFVFVSADATMPLEALDDQDTQISNKQLRLEKRSRRVWIGTEEILPPLSVAQFKLLEILYENDERVVSRKKLAVGIWGAEEALMVSNQALDALVRRLRDRLAATESNHNYILTVRGHGLRLNNPSE